jgi:RHS repeat-associated protein
MTRVADSRSGASALAGDVVDRPPSEGTSRATTRSAPRDPGCLRLRPHSHRDPSRVSGHSRGGRYCRARYYHPQLQRFISEDPIGFAGGDPNLYAYVGNMPTLHGDPLGLFADIVIDAGFIGYDIGRLVLGGRKELSENLTARLA